MKLGFSTLCCMEYTLEQTIALAKRGNLSFLELRLNKDSSLFQDRLTLADADQIRTAFAKGRLKITDLATGVFLCNNTDENIAAAKAAINFAKALGAPAIRVFAGHGRCCFEDYTHQEIKSIANTLQLLCDYAGNIEIWVENHSAFSTGRSVKALLNLSNRPNAKAIWDVAHSIEYAESPEKTLQYLKDYLVHVHIKDVAPDHRGGKYICTDLGKGCIPIQKIISLLQEADYSGVLSLEWESHWQESLRPLYPDKAELFHVYRAYLSLHQNL